MKNLQNIRDFFVRHTGFNEKEIKTCTFYYDGYTNFSYLIQLHDLRQYQIKITRFKQPTMVNEACIYEQYLPSYLLYSDKEGNIIKQWTEGENLNFDNNLDIRLTLLFKEIKKFHAIKPCIGMKFFDYFCYDKVFASFPYEYLQYKNILEKFKKTKVIVSHNDVNLKNTILFLEAGAEKIHFIDFEWSTLNYQWFDYINLFCEDEIYEEKILIHLVNEVPMIKNIKDVYQLLFVRWFFTLGWSMHEMNRLPNMQEYQERSLKNLAFLKTKIA